MPSLPVISCVLESAFGPLAGLGYLSREQVRLAPIRHPPDTATFCHVGEHPDHTIILANDTALFLQNEKEQGALRGSGVIIPVRHAVTVFDLTRDEVWATFALLKHVKAWMDEHYHPDGYNVGWNCGVVGGQIAMHAHMHVMPRFRQEPYAGRGLRYWLKQPANRWW